MAHRTPGPRLSRNPSATGVRKVGNHRVSDEIAPKFVSLGEAGRVIGYQPKTLHNWISAGTLRTEHGLLKVRGRWRVNLATFLSAFEKGELG
jgi:hypothetical protein